MTEQAAITPADLLSESKLSVYQLRAIVICFLIAALDGFDTQSIAFVAPVLRHSWAVTPEQFGPLFAAGLFGTMIGAVLLSSAADRFGRKPLILFSVLLFGVMSLACSTAESVDSLFIYRLVAGFGLGGAIPNIIALVSEYAPRRIRSTVIVATFTGFPAGAVVGGMASHSIIPAFGWEMVFVLGGVLPLALLPFIFAWVPESLRYLLRHETLKPRATAILERVQPGVTTAREIDYTTDDVHTTKPVRNLFVAKRLPWTILLWLLTFTVLMLGYFLINWSPLILEDMGIPRKEAIMAIVFLNLGGIIGSLILGRISDKHGPFKVVAGAFGIGSVAIAVLGLMVGSPVTTILSIVFVVGLFVFGAQMNITALAANYYPLEMRSTGIGWSMGFGRVGSFVGPLVGGALIAYGFTQGQMFLVAAIPAAVACILVATMAYNVPED